MAKFKAGDEVLIDLGGITDPEIARKARVRGKVMDVVPAGSWAAEGHDGVQMYLALPDRPGLRSVVLFEETELASE
jgi:hypothetical protein